MNKPAIIIVDDQAEVLSTLKRELEFLSPYFLVESCQSAAETEGLLVDLATEGTPVALIVSDHVMPEKSGVELLTDIRRAESPEGVRMLLLTGLATHEDTIRAINDARIDNYIPKPWNPELLRDTIKILLTRFIIEKGFDYRDFLPVLDQPTLWKGGLKQ